MSFFLGLSPVVWNRSSRLTLVSVASNFVSWLLWPLWWDLHGSLVGKDLDLFCYSSIPGYCNLLSCEEETATDADFVPCITKPHKRWGKDCLQQGLAAGGCSGSTDVLWAWYQLGYWSCSCWSNLWNSARGLSQRTELRGTWEILCKYSFTCLCCCTKKGRMQLPVRLDYRQQQHLHPHCPIASASLKSCFGKLFVVTVIAKAWF